MVVDAKPPAELTSLLELDLPQDGQGKEGLVEMVKKILKYSVNTWDQGFLDKLYASTNAVGVISELILAVLNTNVSKPFRRLYDKPCPEITSRAMSSRY